MAISTQTFSQYVDNAVAAIQSAATQLVDLTVGSILLAVVQANAAIALWLQGIALQIAALTRFATSTGSDADSWAADYGFVRLTAVSATGQVTFARFTSTNQASVAVGVLVQTADGTQQYQVIADTAQPTFNSTLNAYIIPPGTASAVVTVQSVNAASAANVAANSISILAQSIPFIDTVSNAAPIAGGADPESDQAFKGRFVLYLQSLTQGTKQACINAVANLQEGASCSITENVNVSGVAQPGYFFAVVDDGTGVPSDNFLAAAVAAIDRVRAIGTSFGVFRPTIVTANVAMTVSIAAGFTGSAVRAAVSAAISAYITTLSEGATLPYNFLSSLAFSVPGVTNVAAGFTLNGGTADLTTTPSQIIKAGTVTIS